MKLLNLKQNNKIIVGIKTEKGIISLEELGVRLNKEVPATMEELISDYSVEALDQLIKEAGDNINYIQEEDIDYAPVVTNPEKILCVGLNYMEHIEEARTEEVPDEPVIFSKFNNTLVAHNENVPVPSTGEQFDYEAELVIVIGEEVNNVSKKEALNYVFGYTIGNDLSIRDLQFKSGRQWLLGKTADGFAPVGPHIVTSDSIDPTNLDISMKRNGEIVQSSNTKYMIFDVATIVSYLSKHMTLKPGDLIYTGTPEGVVIGFPENERNWVKAGEEFEVTIESIGSLYNTFGR